MASIIIHLAVTANVLMRCGIEAHRDEYLFGTILPDYNFKENHHYKQVQGKRKFFDLTGFRNEHRQRLKEPIYLGYYLHLAEDMIFRDFMYNIHGFSSAKRKNVLKLYGDYQRLNTHLARKYLIPVEILKNTDGISPERYPDFPLNKAELTEETEKYHNVNICPEGDFFFFTPVLADDYIKRASDICIHELSALKGEREHINEMDYSWSSCFD